MRLNRSATYRADLEQIVDYIARESPKAALAIWDEIETQVERLVAYPNSGRAGRVEGTRELIINRTPFIVGYRVTADSVVILRVLHGAKTVAGRDRQARSACVALDPLAGAFSFPMPGL